MVLVQKINPVVRAILVIASVAALVTGVTFAALQSNNVVLADSDFATATASLKIWDGDSYDVTTPGFTLNNLVPSVQSSEVTFWLKNDGGAALTVTGLGSIDGYTGFTDFSKVHFEIRNITDPTGSPITYTFAQLIDGTPDPLPGNPLDPTEENQYGVKILIDSDALAGSSASVDNFDWTFSGTNP